MRWCDAKVDRYGDGIVKTVVEIDSSVVYALSKDH